MSAKNDAFIRINAVCPICQREATHRYVKSKMFTPTEVEDDRFVRKYRVEVPAFQNLRPEYYHVWHCPHCHFCDEKEIFRGEDDAGGKLEILREKLLVDSRRPDSLITRLGTTIDMQAEFVTWSSTLAAHIVAVYIQGLLTPHMRQNGRLARLYLRCAWLYREKNDPEISGGRVAPEPELQQVLDELKSEWPDGPVDEERSIRKAIEYFKLDLDTAGRGDRIRQEISIMFLLVSLYLRLDEKRAAMGYVRAIFQQATQRRHSSQRALDGAGRRSNISSQQIERLKTLVQWLNNTIERTVALSDRLTELIFADEYPRAREIVLSMDNPTPEGILERLRSEGFYEGTSRRVSQLFKKKLLETELEHLDEAEATAEAEAQQQQSRGFFKRILNMLKEGSQS